MRKSINDQASTLPYLSLMLLGFHKEYLLRLDGSCACDIAELHVENLRRDQGLSEHCRSMLTLFVIVVV